MADRTYSEQELFALHERREKTLSQKLSTQKWHFVLFEPYNISHSEYRVLATLYFNGDSEPSFLADKLQILRQTMTKLVDSLESKGLVSRAVHPSDRRRLYISLLPKGTETIRELLCIESDFYSRVEAQFTEAELEAYLDLSSRIRSARAEVMQEIVKERSALRREA